MSPFRCACPGTPRRRGRTRNLAPRPSSLARPRRHSRPCSGRPRAPDPTDQSLSGPHDLGTPPLRPAPAPRPDSDRPDAHGTSPERPAQPRHGHTLRPHTAPTPWPMGMLHPAPGRTAQTRPARPGSALLIRSAHLADVISSRYRADSDPGTLVGGTTEYHASGVLPRPTRALGPGGNHGNGATQAPRRRPHPCQAPHGHRHLRLAWPNRRDEYRWGKAHPSQPTLLSRVRRGMQMGSDSPGQLHLPGPSPHTAPVKRTQVFRKKWPWLEKKWLWLEKAVVF